MDCTVTLRPSAMPGYPPKGAPSRDCQSVSPMLLTGRSSATSGAWARARAGRRSAPRSSPSSRSGRPGRPPPASAVGAAPGRPGPARAPPPTNRRPAPAPTRAPSPSPRRACRRGPRNSAGRRPRVSAEGGNLNREGQCHVMIRGGSRELGLWTSFCWPGLVGLVQSRVIPARCRLVRTGPDPPPPRGGMSPAGLPRNDRSAQLSPKRPAAT